jgi:hypothetical protein
MKKKFATALLALVVVFSCLAFAACDFSSLGLSIGSSSYTAEDLTGVYHLQSFTIGDTKYVVGDTYAGDTVATSWASIDMFSGGIDNDGNTIYAYKLNSSIPNYEHTWFYYTTTDPICFGRYTVSGSSVKMVSLNSKSVTTTATVDNNTITLQDTDHGFPDKLVLEKTSS